MAIRLRLARLGSKKRPVYRIVAAENTAPRDGKFIEVIGTYNPLLEKSNTQRYTIKTERAEFWMNSGAKPSDRVARIFEKLGIVMPLSARPKSLDKLKLQTPKKAPKHAPKTAETENASPSTADNAAMDSVETQAE
jgi:small subunit ribosomal protein S16